MRIPGGRIAGAKIHKSGVLIIGAAKPGCAAAKLIHIARPGFIGFAGHGGGLALIGAGQAFEHGANPDQFTGFRAARLDAANNTKLTARHAGDNQSAIGFGGHDHRCGRGRIAALEIVNFFFPDLFAGFGIQRDNLRVQRGEIDLVLPDDSAAVDHVTAGQNAFRQTGIILPELFTGFGIDGIEAAVGAGDINNAVMNDGLRLLTALLFAAEGEGPGRNKALDAVMVDLFERAETLALQAQTIGQHRCRGGGIL